MIWLTLYPLGFPKTLLKLQGIDDLNFKLLLLGIAALNFFAAFVLEVGRPRVGIGHTRDACRPFGSLRATPFPGAVGPEGAGLTLASALPSPWGPQPPQNLFSPRLFAADRSGPRLARLPPQATPKESVQEAFQEAGEGAEPAAAILAAP